MTIAKWQFGLALLVVLFISLISDTQTTRAQTNSLSNSNSVSMPRSSMARSSYSAPATSKLRTYGGWAPVQPSQPVHTQPGIQKRYYQGQGSLTDGLPALPRGGLPANTAAPTSSGLSGLPSLPNSAMGSSSRSLSSGPLPTAAAAAGNNPSTGVSASSLPRQITVPPSRNNPNLSAGGQAAVTPTGAPPARLPNVGNTYRGPTNQGIGNQGIGNQGIGNQGVTSAGISSRSNPSAGNQYTGSAGSPLDRSQNLNSAQPVYPPSRGQSGIPGQVASHQRDIVPPDNRNLTDGRNELRQIDRSGRTQDGRLDPRTIATGLPYVTPAPGRYPTSPYNHALFQTAAYQRSVPATPASHVPNYPMVNAQLTSATAPSQPLPQYAPMIYPTAYQCAPPAPSFPSTGAVPGTYVPPTLTPNLTPGLYSANNSGYAPLFSLGQENYNVSLGRGIIGQPTVYVAGQPVRNFLRYLSP